MSFRNTLWLFCLALLGLRQACRPDVVKKEAANLFFDLEAFFQSEAERLASQQKVDKKITMNGVTEQQQESDWNAAEELKGFKDLHINRPAWRDQYLVDSLRGTNGEITGLRYVAVDSTMRIREVEVDWADGAVSEIRVEKHMKNLIVFFHQTLLYRPGQGYSIWRAQKVPLKKKSEMVVEVEF